MLTFSASQRIYVAVEPVDMRKQFNGLWALAAEKLREDPFSGALFVFTNKERDRVKILCWDGTGVWVAAKRLEKGRFSWPAMNGAAKLSMEPAALTMLLAGIDLKAGCKKPWYER
jgi:transposase